MREKNKKILCACSHGGHLTEMNILVQSLGIGNRPVFITYKGNAETSLDKAYFVNNMGKPRNVARGIFQIIRILLKEKPDVVISTGAEIGMFVIILAKLLRRSRAIYIECSAQVSSPSVSGRVIYPFADLFFVQWKPLLNRYGKKAKYKGNLIFGDI